MRISLRGVHEKFSVFMRTFSAPISCLVRSAVAKSSGSCPPSRITGGQTILEDAGEPTLIPQPDYYKDPRNVGRWTEKRFKELGLDVPPEIKKEIQVAREGEPPRPESDMLGP